LHAALRIGHRIRIGQLQLQEDILQYYYWENIESPVVLVATFAAAIFMCACLAFIFVCIMEWWQSPRMRLFRLGGVTTLRRNLDYPCTLCQNSMEAGEKVRTLSCNHVFHCGGSDKCEGIDHCLRTGPVEPCPTCDRVPHPVPWKRTPPPSPLPIPSQGASAAALPRLRLIPLSTRDLDEALLRWEHNQKRAEASSSASLHRRHPRTSTSDKEEVLPLPADDEILPEAPSSQ
jgi:hypothetical protein